MKKHRMTFSLIGILAAACSNVSTEADSSKSHNSAGYFVFNYRVSNNENYQKYLTDVPKTLEAYGAEVVVADFSSSAIEGDPGDVTVVLKFPTVDAAQRWYASPQYQAIINLRLDSSAGLAALASATSTTSNDATLPADDGPFYAISVRNIDEVIAWYAEVLDFKLDAENINEQRKGTRHE